MAEVEKKGKKSSKKLFTVIGVVVTNFEIVGFKINRNEKESTVNLDTFKTAVQKGLVEGVSYNEEYDTYIGVDYNNLPVSELKSDIDGIYVTEEGTILLRGVKE